MKDKIEIIIRHTSAGQTQQFYGVNHYEPEEALRRFHAISSEANEMHWRMLQDSEMKPSPMPDLLEALNLSLTEHEEVCEFLNARISEGESVYNYRAQTESIIGKIEAAIAKAEGRDE